MSRSSLRLRELPLYVLDALLLVAFVGGYLARYTRPERFWWLQLIAVLLPYLAMMVLVATAIVALLRRWRLTWVHLAVVGLVIIRFVPWTGGRAIRSEGLKLATFNAGQLESFREETRADVILHILDDIDADVYAFQELPARYRRSEQRIRNYPGLAQKLDSAGVATSGLQRHDVEFTFLPVWARTERVTLLDMQRFKLDTEDSLSMSLIRVRFDWQRREAVLYNIHLHTFGQRKPWSDAERHVFSLDFWRSYLGQYKRAFLQRARETDAIRAMLDAETLPVIVCGDFNSTVHNWSYHQLARGMQDAFSTAGSGWGNTYHSEFPVARIDHVLVSSEWTISEAHIEPLRYSDHRPLQVTIAWRE